MSAGISVRLLALWASLSQAMCTPARAEGLIFAFTVKTSEDVLMIIECETAGREYANAHTAVEKHNLAGNLQHRQKIRRHSRFGEEITYIPAAG